MKDNKNQMIRSMKSYQTGGASGDCNSRDGGCGAKKLKEKIIEELLCVKLVML